jgi:hypothetical protein
MASARHFAVGGVALPAVSLARAAGFLSVALVGSIGADAGWAATLVLRWTDNSDNEDGFRIERVAPSGNFATLGVVGANVTTFVDSGLASGTTHTYRVCAFNAWGDSDYSNLATATAIGTPPANTPPTVGSIAGRTVVEGGSTGPILLDLGDLESGPGDLVLRAVSSNHQLVPADGIVFGWAGDKRTISVRPAQGATGAAVITVSASDGSLSTSRVFTLSVVANRSVPGSRLLNLSTRVRIGPVGGVHHAGFVVGGDSGRRLLLRAVGPTLAVPPFDLAGFVANPAIALERWNGRAHQVLAENDDWGASANASEIAAVTARIGGFALAEGAADSALLVDLPAGVYSVQTQTSDGDAGVVLAEAYDADDSPDGAGLLNMSSFGFVGLGNEVMISGLVLGPSGRQTLLIRAVGPTLAAPPFGLEGTLGDPSLAVYHRADDGGTMLTFANDDWWVGVDAAFVADAARSAGAFALSAGGKDAAALLTLTPGVYTIVVQGQNGETGNALVEIYTIP